ncbi:MAG: hypothetical protein ACKVS8_14620 [Phycisphaerales bacterium]
MSEPIPPTLAAFLQTLATEGRSPAYIRLDAGLRLADWGGSIAHYGVHGLVKGAEAERSIDFLTGLLPLEAASASFRGLGVVEGVTADLHLMQDRGQTWVLLLDATEEMRSRQEIQQVGNDLALDRERLARRVRALEAEVAALRARLGGQ